MNFSSYRVAHYDSVDDDQTRVDELDLADEKRKVAAMRLERMKRQVAQYYDKKMCPHGITVGAQVLKRDFRSNSREGKLAPKWKGPYRVRVVVGARTFKLEHPDGKVVKRTWNAQNLRLYQQSCARLRLIARI
ncbi:unnamed protein product [Linum trigynum]|uniref:Uncharacterized protein n=1 Tax=Linum trigynum TaxID=586398 RepID=A0AAV2D829_9ROSI